ncbi:MAG TPA: hypothetical protein GX717_02040, partial [Clostridiaceae bacterium]|nr:hypothetical protein [Clostridiaceae bacterium]
MSIFPITKKVWQRLLTGSAAALCAVALLLGTSVPVIATSTTKSSTAATTEQTIAAPSVPTEAINKSELTPSPNVPSSQKSSSATTTAPATQPESTKDDLPLHSVPIDVTAATADATAGTTYKITVKDKVNKGDNIPVEINLLNHAATDLPQVRLIPYELDKNEFFTWQQTDKQTPEAFMFAIKGGEHLQIRLPLIAKKDLPAGSYDIQLALTAPGYQNRLITCKVIIQRIDTPVTTEAEPTTTPSLPDLDGSDLPAKLPSDGSMGDLDPSLINQINPGLDANGVYDFGFDMAGGMPGGFSAAGAGFDPMSYSGSGGSATEMSGNNKPKLIISNYSLVPSMPEAGKDFTMDLTFTNTNSKKDVNNIKITLNAESGSSGGIGMGGPGSGASATTSDSVFSPVGS